MIDNWKWLAVGNRNAEFDGVVYFGVRTTGIFCRPSCPSRAPKRENVLFFDNPKEAESAGFRACLRCKPKDDVTPNAAGSLIKHALELMTDENEFSSIEEIAEKTGVSMGHLQKTFKTVLGLSPKEAADKMRIENFKKNVKTSDVVTSLYDSGFGSSRSLYEKAGERLGMTPAVYKKGGKGMKIVYTIADSTLGKMLVAATEKGICAVSFGDDADTVLNELKDEFFAAEIEENNPDLQDSVNAIIRSLGGEKTILKLPLDLRSTAFQMRVWAELRKIPFGETRSYAQVANAIGNPNAIRAVARACATNPVALVNPCHRVIASNGALSGYKWGIERKAKILAQESEVNKK